MKEVPAFRIAAVLLSIWSMLLITTCPATENKNSNAKPACHEFWITLRTDGQAGAGTIVAPFDGSSVEKLNALFGKFKAEYGDHVTIHEGIPRMPPLPGTARTLHQ